MIRFAGRHRSSASEEGLAGGWLLREAEHAYEHRMDNARKYLGEQLVILLIE